MMKKTEREQVLAILAKEYADVGTALHFHTPFEFLVAVVLSAQCTDVRVNIVTERLFPIANTPEKIMALGQAGLEEYIKDCGLYRNKAKNIMAASQMLLEKYGGEVPGKLEELLTLPGVGRKTANVLLSQLFNTPAIAVDTHVFRVANRLKLAVGKTPEEVEAGLMKGIPKEHWSEAHHWLIWHGRRVCKARNPLCDNCVLQEHCAEGQKILGLKKK